MQASSKPSHRKSRNGCLKCRANKIKCDERKPACARCVERNIKCPGYALNVRWSDRHQLQAGGLTAKPSKAPAQHRDHRFSIPDRDVYTTTGGRDGDAASASPCSGHPVVAESQQQVSWNGFQFQNAWYAPQDLFNPADTIQAALPDQTEITSALAFLDSSSMMSASWCADFDGSNTLLSLTEPSAAQRTEDDDEHDTANVDDSHREPRSSRQNDPKTQTADDPSTTSLTAVNGNPFASPLMEIFNLPTALTDHFFGEVITLYCCWDSKSNVMRGIVEKMWQSSGALYHTIQSMAAACLSENFPHMALVARKEHGQAVEYIRSEFPSSTNKEDLLLAHMLLGHTSSWLDPQDLATDAFRSSWSMLTKMEGSVHEKSISFFKDTMDYWAMLLVFLTDTQQLGDYRRGTWFGPTEPVQMIEPHPYSGVSRETVNMLTETGTLIFKYRKHMSKVKFLTEIDLDLFREALREARRLERNFIAYVPSELSQIKDPGDPNTPPRHLQLIDEAYRCTGLLQLYRVFPDLLNERYAPWDKTHILRTPAATKVPTAQERQVWLTNLALHVLDILKGIPFESRTRSVQPFIMVAVSSELGHDMHHVQSLHCDQRGECETQGGADQIRVACARKFVSSRLAAYTHILPVRKTRVIFELLSSVWTALDNGERDVYWLDKAAEQNLGTMMG